MRAFLSLVLQTSALDAAGGRVMTVGAFGLGGATALQAAGADMSALSSTQVINSNDTVPSGWDLSLGTYPMGVHWQRSAAVRAQLAVGYNGEAGFRYSSGADWVAWRKLYNNRNILGAVSDSGGAPAGGIIEYGVNSNGVYVRLADGTQFCWINDVSFGTVTSAFGSMFQGTLKTFTYPATFVGAVDGFASDTSSSNLFGSFQHAGGTSCQIQMFCAVSIASVRRVNIFASGRWK